MSLPQAYRDGRTNFYGFDILVTPDTLIPRPETEQLIERTVAIIAKDFSANSKILDVGTGSGAIALTLKKLLPNSRVSAVDISLAALTVAKQNAQLHNVTVDFSQSDVLDSVLGSYDVVIANVPYVPSARWRFLPKELTEHEPRLAIDGGRDGLKILKKLSAQLPGRLNSPSLVALEIDDVKATRVQKLIETALPNHQVWIEKDLAGFDRFCFAWKK